MIDALKQIVREHPRQANQTDDNRTLQVVGLLVRELDEAETRQREERERQAQYLNDIARYPLLSPDRSPVDVPCNELTMFALENNLNYRELLQVVNGEREHCSGWKLRNEEVGYNNYRGVRWVDKAAIERDIRERQAENRREQEALQKRLKAERERARTVNPLSVWRSRK